MIGVLARLRDFVFPPQCAACGEVGSGLCRRCAPLAPPRTRCLPHLAVHAIGAYEGALRVAVLALKDGRRDVAQALGERLAQFIAPGDTLIAVPTSRNRIRSRGIDGVRLMAVAAGGGAPYALLALTSGDAQRGRSRAERIAARERFHAIRGVPSERRLVLVDDVCTTGTTLEDCARALRGAGMSVDTAVVVALA